MGDSVEDTVDDTVEESVEDTVVEELRDEVKQVTKKLTESETYHKSDENNKNSYSQDRGNDPMNPEDIAKHEPTAVKRDKNQGSTGDPV